MNKIQIDFTDSIPLNSKIAINETDNKGVDLYIGDTLIDERNNKYIIGYRYGDISLIPPFGMHTMCVKSYNRYTKLNEMTCVMGKYLIIGYDNEKFFADNEEELSKIKITKIIPQ